MKFVDLFSGAGGLSLGFKKEGFKSQGFVEFWQPAIETMLNNDPEEKLILKDITEVTKKHFTSNTDVVVGGPPCQGFSMAGKREVGDNRNSLFEYYFKVVDYTQPKFCLMENVRGILSMKDVDGKLIINKIISAFKDKGYRTDIKLLNSFNYCVPQKRQRIIIIANKEGIKFDFPEPRSKMFLKEVLTLPYEELPEIQHIYTKKKMLMKKGFYMKPGQKISSFGSAGIKLRWSHAPTITKTGRYIHPGFNRLISVREAARIQTFPDDYMFSGNIDQKYGQIGNAVPVNMARALAGQIKKNIGDD